MKKDIKLLKSFSKRFEFKLMNVGIQQFDNVESLKQVTKKKVCYPIYTYDSFFQDYCNTVSYNLCIELQNTLAVTKSKRIRNYEIFYLYNSSIWDNLYTVVKEYYNEIIAKEGSNITLVDLQTRILELILKVKYSNKRSIEMIIDIHNTNYVVTRREKIVNFVMRLIENSPSMAKPV